LKIVTETHPAEGESVVAAPVYYHFSPLYHAAGLIYLVPIALALGLLKENKKGSALLILLPLLLVWGIWRGFASAMGIPDEAVSLPSAIVISLLTGFTAVWLLGERIGNRHRCVTFLLAVAVMLGCCALMLVEFETPMYRIQAGIVGAISVLILLGGFVFAGVLCRNHFGPVRFVLWMALGLLVCVILILGLYLMILIFQYDMWGQIIFLFFMILIYAGVFWIIVLPFLVLFFVNDFWRRRFAAVMGMGGAAVLETVPEGATEGIGQG
jgi:hypothetical protein